MCIRDSIYVDSECQTPSKRQFALVSGVTGLVLTHATTHLWTNLGSEPTSQAHPYLKGSEHAKCYQVILPAGAVWFNTAPSEEYLSIPLRLAISLALMLEPVFPKM
eukprot:TRINITY_DN18540_c0_g1_i2.p2 TRINITY_DN18540_c0_g1~~TRINITY_DN18540_c0_g1_i2.p2  ORF type:complete len:106 (+),score=14.80 TRINITY_DN18540_c0_g1_i2:82-399(+)